MWKKRIYDDLIKEWDHQKNVIPLDMIFPHSSDSVYWKCSLGHSYQLSVRGKIFYKEYNRRSCPYCDNRWVLPGFNSFKTLHKELMKEWDYKNNYLIVDPDMILDTYNKYPVYWICEKKHHTYKMTLKSRILYKKRNQTACPICKGLRQPKAHYF